MESEIILGLVIVSLVIDRYLTRKEAAQQIKELTRALIAKNATELRDMEMVDKVQIKAELPKKEPDLMPLENLDDEQFNELLEKQMQ